MFSNRNKVFLVLSVMILGLSIVACAAPASPTVAPTTAASSAPAATKAPVATVAPATVAPSASAATKVPVATVATTSAGSCGTLRILYWQASNMLNVHLGAGAKDNDTGRLVIEPLASMAPDGKPVEVLAAEIPTIANGGVAKDLSSITWKLKQGVKWSDGTEFTADDVIFTYKFVSDPKSAATTFGAFDEIKTIEALDKYTVKITWISPKPNYYETFVTVNGGILQKRQFEPFIGAKSKEGPNLKPIGTGPFVVREAKPGDVVTYDINPNYRDLSKGKPCFKEVIFKGGGDATSAARAVFQTGEVDYAWNLQVEAAVLAPMYTSATSKGNFIAVTGPQLEQLALNRSNPDPALGEKRAEPDQPHPFLSDLKVRQALRMVIDATEMAKQLYGDAGVGTCLVLNAPPSLVSKNVQCPKVDAAAFEAANKQLEEAGWKKGPDGIRQKDVGGKTVKMSILFQTSVNTLRQKEQAFIKDAWEKVGTKVELKAIDAGVYFSTDEANPDTWGKFFADVEMYTNGTDSPDPVNYLKNWTCAEIKTKAAKWSGGNRERACNKEYDAVIAQLLMEIDPAKRTELAIKLNDILVNDVVLIPLVARKFPAGVSKQIQGVKPNPWDSQMWDIADWYR